VRPLTTPASTRVHGPWQITAAGLSASKVSAGVRWLNAWILPTSVDTNSVCRPLAAALRGPMAPEVPASVLQRHADVTVIADHPAAAML
jgi:hypothetical protein